MSELNQHYREAVTAAAQELSEMACNAMTWDAHAAVVITKHLTPVLRRMSEQNRELESGAGCKTDDPNIPKAKGEGEVEQGVQFPRPEPPTNSEPISSNLVEPTGGPS